MAKCEIISGTYPKIIIKVKRIHPAIDRLAVCLMRRRKDKGIEEMSDIDGTPYCTSSLDMKNKIITIDLNFGEKLKDVLNIYNTLCIEAINKISPNEISLTSSYFWEIKFSDIVWQI